MTLLSTTGIALTLPVAIAISFATAAKSQAINQPDSGNLLGLSSPSGTPGSNRPSQVTAPVIGTGNSGASAAVPGTVPPGGGGGDEILPAKLGIFSLSGGGTAGAYFDDNVFATAVARRSDVAFFARPELSAVAQGADYGVQASAYLEGRKYLRYASEDQINAGVSVAGVYQPDADTQLRGRVEYLRGHEDRGTGDSIFTTLDRPVAFDQFDGAAALNNRFGRWFTSVGASAVGVLYRNDSLFGMPVDQSYRNVLIPTLTGRVGYVVAPLTSVFAEVTGNRRDFRYQMLSSSGYRVVSGLLFEPGPGARIKGEAFAGFMHQDYSGLGFRTVSSWTYGGAVSFLLTDRLTFTAEGRREAKESLLFGGTSLIESSIGGRFDVQLLDRLVVGAGATYLVDSFQGVGRADRYVSPLASARYTVSKNLTLGLDYRMLDYSSDAVAASGFRRNVVLASVNYRF